MVTRTRLVRTFALLAGAVFVYGSWTAVRAHRNLVTLNVRNMEVRQVVRKIERQTWENIVVNKGVQGRVTLEVYNAPLEAVLDLVAGQVSARSSHLYPIYHKKSSLKELRALLQQASGENGEAKRWTNFAFRGRMGGGGGFRGGFEGMDSATNKLINLRFEDKQPSAAAQTLGFATQTQIVPEDGIDLKVNLELKNVTPEEAVKKFAKALYRNWDNLYVIQSARFGPGREPGEIDPEVRRERMSARLEVLSPEQRARFEEMRNLSPEERQARMQARMEDPAAQQRMIDRSLNEIRNSTPEQMVERKRQRRQMMQNFRPPGQGAQPPR
jgi:type II secretory pathway component GspD/PulD (secretin)